MERESESERKIRGKIGKEKCVEKLSVFIVVNQIAIESMSVSVLEVKNQHPTEWN